MIQAPIFIVGAPRSGTTLLRQMLNRHPRLAICGETHFLEVVYQPRRQRAFGELGIEANRRRLIQAYVSLRRARDQVGMEFKKFEQRIVEQGLSYPAMFASILQCYAEEQGKPRCGEKTPQHALFTQTLLEWFPDAVILHIVRDPRDVISSLLHRPSAAASVVSNARAWLKLNLAARKCSSHPGYLEVRYETLIARPEEELRRICGFVGERYLPAMLVPEQGRVEDSSGMDRFRTPLTASRRGVWRDELTATEAAQVEWALGDQLTAFGYDRAMPPASFGMVFRGVAFAALDTLRMAIQRLPALWYEYFNATDLESYERWRFPPDDGARARTKPSTKSVRA